ncbi:MAG TPA: hypothetical protein VFH06_04775 [Candidatus Saccharimonadales bacterium]|nr:hypothetical protein [Candidatus Saccharimonadales bacterium]
MSEVLRRLGLLLSILVVIAASVCSFVNYTLTTAGVIAVVVGGVLTIGAAFVAFDITDKLVTGVRVAVPMGVAAAMALAMLGTFGPLTSQSPEELVAARQAAVYTSYTGRITVVPVEAGPGRDGLGCNAFDYGDVPRGVFVSHQGTTCTVIVDWTQNGMLALPTLKGENALGQLDSQVIDKGKTIVLTFPNTVCVDLFVTDADSSVSQSLPDWAPKMASFTAPVNR